MPDHLDLSNLSPEQIAQLRAQLGLPGETPMRSPIMRPLSDLRAPTTARGRLNRPHFEWSADPPPEGVVIPPYPCLWWNPRGQEVRVESPEHMKALGIGDGWTARPPMGNELTPEDRLKAEVAQLSPSDREFLLKSVRDARMASLRDKMSGLSNETIAELLPKPPVEPEKVAKKSA